MVTKKAVRTDMLNGNRVSYKKGILPLDRIVFDQSIYPRQKYWWQTAYTYSQAMKAGAIFPPIVVGLIDGKYLLVDGKHRMEAFKLNKETHINCYVLEGMSKDELFIQAVKMNIAHGQNLTPFDKTKIIQKLEDMSFSREIISQIVQVPLGKLTTFVAQRMTVTPVGKPQVVKATLRHLVREQIPVTEEGQNRLSGRSEQALVEQLIQVFSNPDFPQTNDKFVEKVEELYILLKNYLKSLAMESKKRKKTLIKKGKGK